MIGYGETYQSQAQVCQIFNNKNWDDVITQSNKSKVQDKFNHSIDRNLSKFI